MEVGEGGVVSAMFGGVGAMIRGAEGGGSDLRDFAPIQPRSSGSARGVRSDRAESSGDAPALRAWTLRATGSAGRGRFGSDGSALRPRFLIVREPPRAALNKHRGL